MIIEYVALPGVAFEQKLGVVGAELLTAGVNLISRGKAERLYRLDFVCHRWQIWLSLAREVWRRHTPHGAPYRLLSPSFGRAVYLLEHDILLHTYLSNELDRGDKACYFPGIGLLGHLVEVLVWGGDSYEWYIDQLRPKLKQICGDTTYVVLGGVGPLDQLARILHKEGTPSHWPTSISTGVEIRRQLATYEQAFLSVVEIFKAFGVRYEVCDLSRTEESLRRLGAKLAREV